MSRYLGPRLRIVRRLGKLRGLTRKKAIRRRFIECSRFSPYYGRLIPPGQHGRAQIFKGNKPYNTNEADYLIRLKVKQRLRFNYGITERQLVNYVRKAKKFKESTGQVLLQMLEMRLDNIVYRLNMAPTIPAARQLIGHGHIRVNGKKVNIPSYMCKPKDVISVAMKQKSLKLVNNNLQEYFKRMRFYKKRLEKTLAFILSKLQIVPNMKAALELITRGNLRVNNKRVKKPNYICGPKDTISFQTKQGIRQIKLNKYFGLAGGENKVGSFSKKRSYTSMQSTKNKN